MRYFLIFLFSISLFSACQKASPDAKRYVLKGKVVAVNKDKKKVSVAHEPIKGYMDAMTMDFPIHDEDVLNTLTKDAEIQAELVVDDKQGEYWLENIIISAAPASGQNVPPTDDRFAQVGKIVPEFALINQDGKAVSFKDFRGAALAVTFIYSRCPLPNYCILMSKNFSDLANKIDADPVLKDKVRLLSISFDPETDTPETLRKYGLGYLGKDQKYKFKTWQLATGKDVEIRKVADFFGLRYETDEKDKTQFNHALRTVVIAPDGTVRKVFSGSDWTNDELLNALQATLDNSVHS